MLLFIIFNDLSQTSYLKIYRTDLRQFFRVGRTVAVDDQSKIVFRSLMDVSTATNFVGFIHTYAEYLFMWFYTPN